MKGRMSPASAGIRANHAARKKLSAADAQLLDQRLVTRLIGAREVIEQLATLGHELEQSTPGVIVLDVALEVLGEIVDAFREDCDLNLRRTGVAGLGRIGLDDFRLACGRNRDRIFLFLSGLRMRPGRDVVQRGRHKRCARALARAIGEV